MASFHDLVQDQIAYITQNVIPRVSHDPRRLFGAECYLACLEDQKSLAMAKPIWHADMPWDDFDTGTLRLHRDLNRRFELTTNAEENVETGTVAPAGAGAPVAGTVAGPSGVITGGGP